MIIFVSVFPVFREVAELLAHIIDRETSSQDYLLCTYIHIDTYIIIIIVYQKMQKENEETVGYYYYEF